MSRTRIGVVAVGSLLFIGVTASAASAHVTVSSPNAQPGGDATITFQVPDESAAANSVKLQVQFPTDTPFASVAVEPQPGWRYATTTSTLPKPITTDDGDQVTRAVTGVTWTATEGGIKPGEFAQFRLSVGPLPASGSVQFPAIQTYSDGTVVRWVQQPGEGGQEPDNPAPVLTIGPAAGGGTSGAAAAPAASSGRSDHADETLAVAALVVALVALVAAGAALVLSRRAAVAGRRAS